LVIWLFGYLVIWLFGYLIAKGKMIYYLAPIEVKIFFLYLTGFKNLSGIEKRLQRKAGKWLAKIDQAIRFKYLAQR
jgi:hypothetical protein